jgi:hypothetical protein
MDQSGVFSPAPSFLAVSLLEPKLQTAPIKTVNQDKLLFENRVAPLSALDLAFILHRDLHYCIHFQILLTIKGIDASNPGSLSIYTYIAHNLCQSRVSLRQINVPRT